MSRRIIGNTVSTTLNPKNAIKHVMKDGRNTYTLLWENPTPNEAFSSQAIEIGDSLLGYDKLCITYKAEKGNSYDQYYLELKNRHAFDNDYVTGVAGGYVGALLEYTALDTGFVTYIKREVYVTKDGRSIQFLNGVYLGSDNKAHKRDYALIPCKIYGVNQCSVYGSDVDVTSGATNEQVILMNKNSADIALMRDRVELNETLISANQEAIQTVATRVDYLQELLIDNLAEVADLLGGDA